MDVDSVNQKIKLLNKDIHKFSTTTYVIQKTLDNSNSNPTEEKFARPITTKEIQRTTDLMDKNSSYEIELELAVGAQVMLLTNKDFKAGLVNGSRGVITSFHQNTGNPMEI